MTDSAKPSATAASAALPPGDRTSRADQRGTRLVGGHAAEEARHVAKLANGGAGRTEHAVASAGERTAAGQQQRGGKHGAGQQAGGRQTPARRTSGAPAGGQQAGWPKTGGPQTRDRKPRGWKTRGCKTGGGKPRYTVAHADLRRRRPPPPHLRRSPVLGGPPGSQAGPHYSCLVPAGAIDGFASTGNSSNALERKRSEMADPRSPDLLAALRRTARALAAALLLALPAARRRRGGRGIHAGAAGRNRPHPARGADAGPVDPARRGRGDAERRHAPRDRGRPGPASRRTARRW